MGTAARSHRAKRQGSVECNFQQTWRCVDKTKDGGRGGREDRSTQEEERLEEGAVKPENRARVEGESPGQNDPRRTRHAATVITTVIARVVNRTSARDLLRRMREWSRIGACPCACLETTLLHSSKRVSNISQGYRFK